MVIDIGIKEKYARYQSLKRKSDNSLYSVGVDVGATKISFVLMKNNRPLKFEKVPTPKTKEGCVRVLKDNIEKFVSGITKIQNVLGIGIGVPGPLNQKGDLVLNPPNLRYLNKVPLAKIMEKEFIGSPMEGIRVFMENDANCFALGETVLGRAGGAKSVFGVTLGSGLGGGLVINGKIYRGAFGSAGEVGHITLKFDGPKCSCGSSGCFEVYCSEKFFKRIKADPGELAKKAGKGSKAPLKIFKEYGINLGIGLSDIINLFDPEVIVVGGGIANTYRFFEKSMREEIQKRVLSPLSRKYVKIKRAKLGDFSGAMGAALFVTQNSEIGK